MQAARTPVGLEMPFTLSPMAASAAASEPLAVAVARFPAAFVPPLVVVEVVTFWVVLCSSARLQQEQCAYQPASGHSCAFDAGRCLLCWLQANPTPEKHHTDYSPPNKLDFVGPGIPIEQKVCAEGHSLLKCVLQELVIRARWLVKWQLSHNPQLSQGPLQRSAPEEHAAA